MIADKPPSVAQQKLASLERDLTARLRAASSIEGYTPLHEEMYAYLLRITGAVRAAITEAQA